MKFYIHRLLIVAVFVVSIFFIAEAQDDRPSYYYEQLPSFMRPDSTKIKPKRMGQYNDFVNLKTIYPPRPRHKGALEVSAGHFGISGDVASVGGWNVGLGYRWNIGYVLSMRADVRYGVTWGQEFQLKSLVGNLASPSERPHNRAYNGVNNGVNYKDFGYRFGMDNYQTRNADIALNMLININNIKYHKKENRANLYLLFGVGAQMYQARTDVLFDNGEGDQVPYNYAAFEAGSDVINLGQVTPRGDKKEAKQELKDLYGGWRRGRSYETLGEGMDLDNTGFFSWTKNVTFNVGLGMEFLLTKWLVLGLETINKFTIGDDLMDAQRWSEQGDLTQRYDNYNQTNLKFGFNLGSNKKREMPMWWRNPHDPIYERLTNQPDMTEVSNTLESISNDSDGDGIPNAFDMEPNTPKGAIVDSRGRTLDSDGDGCPDHLDPEPYSTPLLPIVDCKNVYDFAAKECCDEKEALIAKRKQDCADTKMPSVKFDSDKYYISPSELASLLDIAKKMQDCPDIRVVVRAISADKNDIKYNEQLSWNRANATVNHLVEKYGISRDRFIIEFVGEKKQNKEIKVIDFGAAVEGQTGSSNPPAPHPGIKAGSDK